MKQKCILLLSMLLLMSVTVSAHYFFNPVLSMQDYRRSTHDSETGMKLLSKYGASKFKSNIPVASDEMELNAKVKFLEDDKSEDNIQYIAFDIPDFGVNILAKVMKDFENEIEGKPSTSFLCVGKIKGKLMTIVVQAILDVDGDYVCPSKFILDVVDPDTQNKTLSFELSDIIPLEAIELVK